MCFLKLVWNIVSLFSQVTKLNFEYGTWFKSNASF